MLVDIDEKNIAFVQALVKDRPRIKTKAFDHLLEQTNSELMAEVMWIYWGEQAEQCLDWPIPALNRHLGWWKFWRKKRTIRELIRDREGRAEVWQILHDASAWV